jgi:hypothetical protein
MQAFWRKTKEWRKLKFADNAGAAHGAIQLRDNERRGTTWTGLGNKWHLGYSNAAILARFSFSVNSFDEKPNILIKCKFI